MAKRTDSNQSEIVKALRGLGVSVQHLHAVGKGCPDILAGIAGKNVLMEIKDGGKPPSRRKLTDDEQRWHNSWLGQVAVVENVEQAIDAIRRAR